MTDGYQSLTEKEKEALRLIVRGHDAKSTADKLGLSVHTINERLRAARRKLSVTSSREAARVLLSREAATHENLAYTQFGEAAESENCDQSPVPASVRSGGPESRQILVRRIGGILIMAIFAISLALLAISGGGGAMQSESGQAAINASADAECESAARAWLTLADASDWQASYEASGAVFRKLNTLENWQIASESARAPFGRVVSRTAIEFQHVNAPPHGYQIVRFRTDFEHKSGAVETVTLERAGGVLEVVGYLID